MWMLGIRYLAWSSHYFTFYISSYEIETNATLFNCHEKVNQLRINYNWVVSTISIAVDVGKDITLLTLYSTFSRISIKVKKEQPQRMLHLNWYVSYTVYVVISDFLICCNFYRLCLKKIIYIFTRIYMYIFEYFSRTILNQNFKFT